ncbi:MAG: YitT family protein [Prevotellaceae bacterium]|jgi:uncharacterized membrane-anchored protein YitT (DUF2179 family)|nr:YitT family protein [Prevotellaceae bacterium]
MLTPLRRSLRFAREYTIITFGAALYVVALKQLMLPAGIVGGGVSGMAALVYYATGGVVEMSYTYLALNVALVAIGFATLGRSFGVKTIYGIVAMTVFLQLFPMPDAPHVQSPLMAAIITGILCGLGLGAMFTQGGSAGGTDIVAMIITKYRNVSVGRVLMWCDLFIIGSSWLLHRDIEKVAYGYVLMGVTAYCVDLALSGNKQSVQIFIFSKRYAAIADRITAEQHRGVTMLGGVGWYTKQESKVLMILARKSEANATYRIVKETDPRAFISVASVMGVFGQGFDSIKVSKKRGPRLPVFHEN